MNYYAGIMRLWKNQHLRHRCQRQGRPGRQGFERTNGADRLVLVTSRFYIIADHDSALSELSSTFARKWGNRIKSYRA